MRAHKAIDGLNNLRVNVEFADAMSSVTSKVESVKALLQQAVTFDFGQVSPENEHTEFGLDLLSRRLLRLPYDVTFFSCGSGHFICHMAKEGDAEYAATLKDTTKGIEWNSALEEARVVFVPGTLFVTQLDVTKLGSVIPSSEVVTRGHYPHNFEVRWWHIAGCTNKLPHMTPISLEDQQADACRSAGVVAGLVAMLMSKDVESVRRAPPDALNRQRKRKGKALINDVYEVRIRLRAASQSKQDSGGSHASPRMHWRRGHYRKIGERLVPVAPCIVNAADGAQSVNPKDYVFPASFGWNAKRAH